MKLFSLKIKAPKKRKHFAPITKQETNKMAYNRKRKHKKPEE